MEEQPVHVTTTEARAGTTPHIVRYVLGASLALVIVVFLVLGLAKQF
jgi:hypothetical protein